MNKPLVMLATAALLGASLLPSVASAQSAFAAPVSGRMPAVCTAWEPIERRSGVSFYGGNEACTALAANPTVLLPYIPVALDPDYAKVTMVCIFPIGGPGEMGAAWSDHSYEFLAAAFCYEMRKAGMDVSFIDPAYT